MKAKQNIIICDCEASEVEEFKDGLESFDVIKYEIKSHISNGMRKNKLSDMTRYLRYFFVAFHYFFLRKKYATIVGWQQFYGLIIAYFCSLFHVKKTNKLIVMNFTYKKKTKFAKIYHSFMKKCLNTKYVDYICVLSHNYAVEISIEFNYPLDRILVFGFGIKDEYEEFSKMERPTKYKDAKYALSIGRSNRDFGFLINAWESIDLPLVIISDTYKGKSDNPRIEILRNVVGRESHRWIFNCEFVIIPISDGNICSGDTVLLTAMSLKKKVIVTSPSTLSEMYVRDGVNGYCIGKNKHELESVINKISLESDDNTVGENARVCYQENYSRKQMGINTARFIKGETAKK